MDAQPLRISGRQRSASVERLAGKPGEIMMAARSLFEKNGVRSTSITRIAKEAGITRELFYYYFKNKQAVIDAVVDDYVADLVETVLVWNEFRSFGRTPESLHHCIVSMRQALYDKSGPRPMIRVLEELGIRDSFDVRAVRETVNCMDAHIVSEYAAYHHVEIKYVREMLALLIFGLVGLLKIEPDISDETLERIVAQTLRLDMRVIDPPC